MNIVQPESVGLSSQRLQRLLHEKGKTGKPAGATIRCNERFIQQTQERAR